MSAISNYLEEKLLNFLFRSATFEKPTNISVALTNGRVYDNHTGATMPEIPTGVVRGNSTVSSNYERVSLGSPLEVGDQRWSEPGSDNTTAYYVYSQEVGNSGYFYPLYLSESTSNAVGNGTSNEFTFPQTFPGVTFFAPSNNFSEKQAENPDPNESVYQRYEGDGFIKNTANIIFKQAYTDWGTVSGIAVLDSSTYGEGNILMYAELKNPRQIYTGDNIKFDPKSLEISLK